MDHKDLHLLIDSRRLGEDAVPEAERAELAELNERLAGDERAVELYRRIQRADVAVSEAIRDVPVPEALAEKILVSLKAARLGDVIDSEHEPSVVAPAPVSPATPSSTTEAAGPAGRRRSILVAALSVAAASLALWIVYLRQPVNVTVARIENDVDIAYEEGLAQSDPEWIQEEPDDASLKALGKFIHEDYHTIFRSRRLTVGGYRAVAHDLLTIPDNAPLQVRQQLPRRVTLIVIERRVAGLDYTPPAEPRNTQGRCLGVWQSERFVYALMVEGTEDQYRGVLRHQVLS
jgi:hypothetical protein